MKRCCLALLAWLPLMAFAYPTDLKKQMNGAEVSVTAQEIDSNIGGIMLYNYGESVARCKAVFRNGPEAPRTRSAELKPGEDVIMTARFARNVIRLRVDVTCGLQ